ncbi:hypothetical protein ACFL47_09660, partial [Candidatus Latescibacterota bacterium]
MKSRKQFTMLPVAQETKSFFYVKAACIILLCLMVTGAALADPGDKFIRPYKKPGRNLTAIDRSGLAAISRSVVRAVGSRLPASKAVTVPLSDIIGAGDSIHRNDRNGTPVFLDRKQLGQLRLRMGKLTPGMSLSDRALRLIEANHDVFRIDNSADELKKISESITADKSRHVRFEQQFRGIPLLGHQLVVHYTSNGDLYAFNARYAQTPSGLDTDNITVVRHIAIDKAATYLASRTTIRDLDDFTLGSYVYSGPEAGLVIITPAGAAEPLIAWHVMIRPNTNERWRVFVDASSGEIVDAYNDTVTYSPATAVAVDALDVSRQLHVTEHEGIYYLHDSAAG